MPTKIYIRDIEGRFLTINKEYARDIGLKNPEASVGKTLIELISPKLKASIEISMAEDREVMKTGKSIIGKEIFNEGEDGNTHYMSTKVPWKDNQGKVLGLVGLGFDVTKLKEAEAELKKEYKLRRALIDNIPDFIYVKDRESRFINCNQALSDALGLASQDEIIGKTDFDFFPEEMAKNFHADEKKIFQTFQPIIGKKEHIKDVHGDERWFSTTKVPLRNVDGEVEWLVGINRDITEIEDAEESLTQERNMLRTMIDQLPSFIFVRDTEGKFIILNQAYADFLRLDNPHDAIGKTILDLASIHLVEDAKKSLAEDKELINTGHSMINKERAYNDHEGNSIYEITSKVPIKDNQGKPLWVVGISLDVTEKKHIEQKNREQAALLDKAHNAIIVRDLENRIVYWNAAAENLYGYTAEQAVGQNSEYIFYNNDAPKIPEMDQAIKERGEWHGEIKQLRKDNTPITVICSKTLVRDEEGNPTSILMINSDVTEQKKMELQILRSQRMEGIGTLAGGIAHDLNNLLAPISLSSEMLLSSNSDSKTKKKLSIILSSAERAASVVQQLITFAKGIDGKRAVIHPKHNIMEMVQIAKETFPKNINISTVIADDLWTIKGNTTQLHQILLNLCLNSRDAMPGGGNLYVMAENIQLDKKYVALHPEAKAGPYVVIEIADTGMGMSNETLKNIFDPFYTTKMESQGTGLGLSTTHGIVKSHGGFINVESEEGKGSHFRVYIPAEISDKMDISVKEKTFLPKAKGELILVVDDEAHICEMVVEVLENQGYSVLTAEDGTDALAKYAKQENEVQVVLTDIAMPYLDGVSLVQTLWKLNPDLKIIVSTGEGEKAKIQKLKILE